MVAALAALLAAGCGGPGSSSEPTTPRSAPATSSPTTVTTPSPATTTSAVSTGGAGRARPSAPATTRPRTSAARATPVRPPAPKPAPKPSPTPDPKPPTGGGIAGQVLSLVNTERSKAGCGALRTSSALQRAAQGHSSDMAARDYFSHTSKDGRSFADRIRAAGYSGGTVAENIAAGQASAPAVMRSWMGSAGHRANILNCAFTVLGVGYATGGSYGHYWTQDFGG